MTTDHEEAAKRIAHAILDRSTEGTATRVALKQSIAGGGERDLGGLNAIALTMVISEQLAALIADVRRQARFECVLVCESETWSSKAADAIRARLEEGK